MLTAINYRGRGTLVSCIHRMQTFEVAPKTHRDLYWILVDLEGREDLHPATMGHHYVVSAYLNEAKEWLNGHYFASIEGATVYLAERLQEDVEIMLGLRE